MYVVLNARHNNNIINMAQRAGRTEWGLPSIKIYYFSLNNSRAPSFQALTRRLAGQKVYTFNFSHITSH